MTTLPGLPSAVANGDRRKKPPITYGKPTRNATFSTTGAKSFYEASKHSSPSKLKRPTTSKVNRAESTGDDFDIPLSDEEPSSVAPRITKTLKSPSTGLHVNDGNGEVDSASPRKRKRIISQAAHPVTQHTRTPGKAKEFEETGSKDTVGDAQPRRSKRQTTAQHSATPALVSPRSYKRTSMVMKSPKLQTTIACPSSPIVASPASPADSVSRAPITPKQEKLWHELLLSDPPETDTHQSTTGLSHTSSQRVPARSTTRIPNTLVASSSDTHKARIVDHLKPEGSNSDDSEVESIEDSDEFRQDAIRQDAVLQAPQVSIEPKISVTQEAARYSQSQNRLQTQSSTTSQKVTYARSRTYLQDSLEDMIFSDLPIDIAERPSAASRRTKAVGTSKNGPKTGINDDSDDGLTQGIRSIHDLRAAGHKNRFLDDANRLIDDIKSPKPSTRAQRRSALMELAGCLVEKDFTSRFIEYGFDSSIVAQLQYSDMDDIANVLLCIIIARMAQSSESLLQGGSLEFLASQLGHTKDVNQLARDRRSNMSKVAQSDFIKFMESVRASDAWGTSLPENLSPRLVALMGIESLVVTHRRNGNVGAILPASIGATLADLAIDTDPAPRNISQTTRNTALSALEAATLHNVESASSSVWSVQLLSRIAAALPSFFEMPRPSQALALRLCVSATNTNEENCSVFCEVVTLELLVSQVLTGFDQPKNKYSDADCDRDILVLALGLLINLANESEAAREGLLQVKDDMLIALVGVFLRGRENSADIESEENLEQMQDNVVHGWLAVFLGTACLNSRVREQVRKNLPNHDDSVLIEAVEQFVLHHQQVDSQTMDEEHDMSAAYAHHTRQLTELVTCLRNNA